MGRGTARCAVLDLLEKAEARQMLHKIPVEQYFRIAENLKTELIRGVIFDKMPKSQLHTNLLLLLSELLREKLGEQYSVMSENPLALADSAPEPDIAIIDRVRSLDTPRFTTAYLAVEISVTTKLYDAAKADIYAEADISYYWQILPLEKKTVVYAEPADGKYQSVTEVPFESELKVELPGKKITVLLAEIK